MAKNFITSRMTIFAGAAILIVLVMVFLLTPDAKDIAYSTHNAKPDGTKALFLLLSQEGCRAAQLLAAAPPEAGLMIVVEPPAGSLREQDWQRVLAWVEKGNTLLVASDNEDDLYKSLKYELITVTGKKEAQPISSHNPLLKDVQELAFSGQKRLLKQDSMVLAYGDEQGIYLAECEKGKGRVILVTVPDLFTNGEISKKDNLNLFLNIVRLYGKQGIWFSEYSHGYAWADTKDWFTWPLRFVAIQVALALGLLFYFWGKRFGRPIPLPSSTGQLIGDYVSSLANIYRLGRARHLILESLYASFRKNLVQYLGVSKTLSDAELIEIFSRRPGIDSLKLKELLARCADLLKGSRLSEGVLFIVARDIELWQENNIKAYAKRRTNYDG
ncbi:MAG: hypothetical protein H6Q67_436 [Firmicutes bacterium]|nr:hypothetical protein [Bacillota bacterium]